MTGGFNKDNKIPGMFDIDKTEMMTMSENKWRFVNSANLPIAMVDTAALTINNQVYLFGNISNYKLCINP